MTSIPSKMVGVQLIGHGGPEMLQINSDIEVPQPAAGEVLIKVSAAGVNNTDINTRIGWYSKNDNSSEDAGWSGTALQLPRIQGADVCGHIVAVGEGVAESRIGERIIIEPCIFEMDGKELEVLGILAPSVMGGLPSTPKHNLRMHTVLMRV